ncbi:conserved Plasmodium protein, unknown function [Plasmodium ovale wallikeri]|uniref:Uncharacterized protein n=1 Tax=Plasmodium ovale wallikeri TaxID=864142 RepID=A0A1A8ZR28_PLAOA|nr:conserved Plasmodium protein, unknown function [Plasmodium ovale wallikeri]SBT46575.1 conserved Plasmodium protein, unknown function [Plasmodium ovale wallikeri]
MNAPKKKNKSLLETLSKEDVVTLNAYKEEHRDLFNEIEADAKDALYRNNEIKKSKKLSLLIPLNSKTSLSNISLLRNFTRVNSLFFTCCSNYYSPLNGMLKGSPRNFLSTSKGRLSKGEEANGEGMMGKRPIGERVTEGVNYIQRNIKDIQRRSEFLDLYFMKLKKKYISLIKLC